VEGATIATAPPWLVATGDGATTFGLTSVPYLVKWMSSGTYDRGEVQAPGQLKH
jgi:hypothetical protein